MPEDLPKRKRLRWINYDYNSPGAYFITICTDNRKNILCNVVGAIHESPEMKLTEYGKIVEKIINNIPLHLKSTINKYVIMPNHVHLIVVINDSAELRAIRESPLRGRSIISKTVGYIKMNSSKEIHKHFKNNPVWQRGFHDHVIRDREDYVNIYKYIATNPSRWKQDCFYTEEL